MFCCVLYDGFSLKVFRKLESVTKDVRVQLMYLCRIQSKPKKIV